MEWLVWAIYWIEVLNALNNFLVDVAIVFGSLTGMLLLLLAVGELEVDAAPDSILKSIAKWVKRFATITIIAGLLSVFIPSKDTMTKILAIKAVDVVSQTEEVKRIVPKAVEVVEKYLDSILEDAKDSHNGAEISKEGK